MDIISKVLSKPTTSWTDVQKSLKTTIQVRNFAVNKTLIKQCTDILVKHIKTLNQSQVIEQLESLSQSSNLGFSKRQLKDNSNVWMVYLHSDDFFFEVPINSNGEIGDVKFVMFKEPPQYLELGSISKAYRWNQVYVCVGEHRRYSYCSVTRENAYKALKFLENDIIALNNFNKQYYKTIDRVVHESTIGLFKKSDIGHSMRLIYYVSPQDLIFSDQNENSLMTDLNEENLFKYELGSFLSISLTSSDFCKLPDISLLRQERDLENKLVFDSTKQFKGFNVPGTFLMVLNKPIVMCVSTIKEIESYIGLKLIDTNEAKIMPYFELLAKSVHGKMLNDSYSVQLSDEIQIYYITDAKEVLAAEIAKIPFIHPNHIQFTIKCLREQQLLNELSLSCMRKTCYNACFQSARILEIGLHSASTIFVIMQHPNLNCYTTIEIDVSNGNIKTVFRDHSNLHDPNVINEVIKRCHSIPVTMRALLMKYKQNNIMFSDNRNENGNASVQQVYGTNNDSLKKTNAMGSNSSSYLPQQNQFMSDELQKNDQSFTKHANLIEVNLPTNLASCSNFNLRPQATETNFEVLNITTKSAEIICSEEKISSAKDIDNLKKSSESDEIKVLSDLNVKKRKSSITDISAPKAKKKLLNVNNQKSAETKVLIDLKSELVLNKQSKLQDGSNKILSSLESSDLKKSFKNNASKSNNKTLTTISTNLNKELATANHGVKAPVSTVISSNTSPIMKGKIMNKEKNVSNKMKPNKHPILSNTDASMSNSSIAPMKKNISNVNMRIKPITKDGLKIRISKEPTKSSQSFPQLSSNVSSPNITEVAKPQSNNVSILNASITNQITTNGSPLITNIQSNNDDTSFISSLNGSLNSSSSFVKHDSLNESLNEKILDSVSSILPKYEPKSKIEKRPSSNIKRSISSAPTTPNYNDGGVSTLSNSSLIGLKNKSITPPSCIDLISNALTTQTTKLKTNPITNVTFQSGNIKTINYVNNVKSNFKIPHKSKSNVENSESSMAMTNNPIRNQISNAALKKTETTQMVSPTNLSPGPTSEMTPNLGINNVGSQALRVNKYNAQSEDDASNKGNLNTNGTTKDINTTNLVNKTVPIVPKYQGFNTSQPQNFSATKTLHKDKSFPLSSKSRVVSPSSSTSLINNINNSRPSTPIPTLQYSQSYNRNNRGLMSNDNSKIRNQNAVNLINIPVNNSNNNNNSNSNISQNNNNNCIIITSSINTLTNTVVSNNSINDKNNVINNVMTPTSPASNLNEESPSKLTSCIPPDSPANNTCETTTIPKLIPLERNSDFCNNLASEHIDLQAKNNNSLENYITKSSSSSYIGYKCENSPEESSLVIDLVSSTLISSSYEKLEKVTTDINSSEPKESKNTSISLSKADFTDIYDSNIEAESKSKDFNISLDKETTLINFDNVSDRKILI